MENFRLIIFDITELVRKIAFLEIAKLVTRILRYLGHLFSQYQKRQLPFSLFNVEVCTLTVEQHLITQVMAAALQKCTEI